MSRFWSAGHGLLEIRAILFLFGSCLGIGSINFDINLLNFYIGQFICLMLYRFLMFVHRRLSNKWNLSVLPFSPIKNHFF